MVSFSMPFSIQFLLSFSVHKCVMVLVSLPFSIQLLVPFSLSLSFPIQLSLPFPLLLQFSIQFSLQFKTFTHLCSDNCNEVNSWRKNLFARPIYKKVKMVNWLCADARKMLYNITFEKVGHISFEVKSSNFPTLCWIQVAESCYISMHILFEMLDEDVSSLYMKVTLCFISKCMQSLSLPSLIFAKLNILIQTTRWMSTISNFTGVLCNYSVATSSKKNMKFYGWMQSKCIASNLPFDNNNWIFNQIKSSGRMWLAKFQCISKFPLSNDFYNYSCIINFNWDRFKNKVWVMCPQMVLHLFGNI